MNGGQVSLHAAGVCFGGTWALRDVDFAIGVGERVALVGANGSGKSTLLRAVHGLLPLACGERRTAAAARSLRAAAAIPAASALAAAAAGPALPHAGPDSAPRSAGPRIAMVFQRPYMLRSSVLANVELGLRLAGVSGTECRERANAALHGVGLHTLAARHATTLSSGQQQRLALARACAVAPDLLLLDEPTASLDPTAKREVETLIAEVAGQGVALLFASHNLGQVKRLASRVVYLEHGRVLADVPTAQFFDGLLPAEAALFLKGELPWERGTRR